MTAFTPDDASTVHTDLDDCNDEVEDLRATLRSRPVIDQAKGILIAERGCTPDEAFDMLCAASQRENRKIRDIAEAMVDRAQTG